MSLVSFAREGDVCVLAMDDGKMNSFGFQLIKDTQEALDKVLQEPGSVSVLLKVSHAVMQRCSDTVMHLSAPTHHRGPVARALLNSVTHATRLAYTNTKKIRPRAHTNYPRPSQFSPSMSC